MVLSRCQIRVKTVQNLLYKRYNVRRVHFLHFKVHWSSRTFFATFVRWILNFQVSPFHALSTNFEVGIGRTNWSKYVLELKIGVYTWLLMQISIFWARSVVMASSIEMSTETDIGPVCSIVEYCIWVQFFQKWKKYWRGDAFSILQKIDLSHNGNIDFSSIFTGRAKW